MEENGLESISKEKCRKSRTAEPMKFIEVHCSSRKPAMRWRGFIFVMALCCVCGIFLFHLSLPVPVFLFIFNQVLLILILTNLTSYVYNFNEPLVLLYCNMYESNHSPSPAPSSNSEIPTQQSSDPFVQTPNVKLIFFVVQHL